MFAVLGVNSGRSMCVCVCLFANVPELLRHILFNRWKRHTHTLQPNTYSFMLFHSLFANSLYMQLDHTAVCACFFFSVICSYDYETWELLNWLQFFDLHWHSPTSMIPDKQNMLESKRTKKKHKTHATHTTPRHTAQLRQLEIQKSQLIKFGLAFDKVHHTHLLRMTNAARMLLKCNYKLEKIKRTHKYSLRTESTIYAGNQFDIIKFICTTDFSGT